MSHKGIQETSVKIKSQQLLDEALEILVKMHGGSIHKGLKMMKGYRGQEWEAVGTVLKDLRIASYGTDVDIQFDGKSLKINGDAHGLGRIEKEVARAYELAVRKRALQQMGMRVKMRVNQYTNEVVMAGER